MSAASCTVVSVILLLYMHSRHISVFVLHQWEKIRKVSIRCTLHNIGECSRSSRYFLLTVLCIAFGHPTILMYYIVIRHIQMQEVSSWMNQCVWKNLLIEWLNESLVATYWCNRVTCRKGHFKLEKSQICCVECSIMFVEIYACSSKRPAFTPYGK